MRLVFIILSASMQCMCAALSSMDACIAVLSVPCMGYVWQACCGTRWPFCSGTLFSFIVDDLIGIVPPSCISSPSFVHRFSAFHQTTHTPARLPVRPPARPHACMHAVRCVHSGRADELTGGWAGGRADKRTDGRMDGRTDTHARVYARKPSCVQACTLACITYSACMHAYMHRMHGRTIYTYFTLLRWRIRKLVEEGDDSSWTSRPSVLIADDAPPFEQYMHAFLWTLYRPAPPCLPLKPLNYQFHGSLLTVGVCSHARACACALTNAHNLHAHTQAARVTRARILATHTYTYTRARVCTHARPHTHAHICAFHSDVLCPLLLPSPPVGSSLSLPKIGTSHLECRQPWRRITPTRHS